MTITKGEPRDFHTLAASAMSPRQREPGLRTQPAISQSFRKRSYKFRQLQIIWQMDNPVVGQTEWSGQLAGVATASTWAGYINSRQLATAARSAAPREIRREILASDAAGDSEGNGLRYDQFERREPASHREAMFTPTSELSAMDNPSVAPGGAATDGDATRVRVFHHVDYQA